MGVAPSPDPVSSPPTERSRRWHRQDDGAALSPDQLAQSPPAEVSGGHPLRIPELGEGVGRAKGPPTTPPPSYNSHASGLMNFVKKF